MSDNIRRHPINVGQAQIDDLHQRLKHTRWVNKETTDDWSQGIPLAYMREIHQTWLEDYDWRACEDKINAAGSFMTTIMDLDIHFLHVRSPDEGARPLILTHGWPGSNTTSYGPCLAWRLTRRRISLGYPKYPWLWFLG